MERLTTYKKNKEKYLHKFVKSTQLSSAARRKAKAAILELVKEHEARETRKQIRRERRTNQMNQYGSWKNDPDVANWRIHELCRRGSLFCDTPVPVVKRTVKWLKLVFKAREYCSRRSYSSFRYKVYFTWDETLDEKKNTISFSDLRIAVRYTLIDITDKNATKLCTLAKQTLEKRYPFIKDAVTRFNIDWDAALSNPNVKKTVLQRCYTSF